MFVSINQIQIGITNFIEHEIATKAVGAQKFATYFILPLAKDIVAYNMNKLRKNEFLKSLFNETGNVDIDALYNMSKSAIQKSGSFEILGVILGETDIDKIYSHIRNTVV
jgi:hypothetical protein